MDSELKRVAVLRKAREELVESHSHRMGTVRIDLKHDKNLQFDAICWDESSLKFEVKVDEPRSRGGDNVAPAPLSYFILGAASCLLTQYQKLILMDELKVRILGCTARAHFDYVRAGVFRDIVYSLKVEGQERPDVIQTLAKKADSFCYASNTLRSSLKIVVEINYNGAVLT